MIDATQTLKHSSIRELVPVPPNKKIVGCRRVYAIKVGPNGQIDHLKAHLEAKGYTQIYGLDCGNIFFPDGKNYLSSTVSCHSRHPSLATILAAYKNAFIHSELEEEIYGLKQSPRA